MKETSKGSVKRVPCLLLLCVAGAAQSQGLGLGVAEGIPRLGRPLTLTVPVNGAPDAWATGACVSGDVYYGDILLPQGSVRLALASEPGASQGRLTLQTTQAVNEAFVTVELRLGCQGTLTRRYVLLTEWPDATTPEPAQSVLTVPSTSELAGSPPPLASSLPTQGQGTTARVAAKPHPQTQPRAESSGRSLQTTSRLTAQTSASRLRLESADEWAILLSSHGADDAPLRLRLSTEWPLQVQDGMTRKEAADAWKVFRSTPEEQQSWLETATESQAKLEIVRAENTRLQEASRMQDEALRQVQSRHTGWTFGLSLAGIFAVIWGFVVWQRHRRREAQTWDAWNKASRWINAWNEGAKELHPSRRTVALTSAAPHISARPEPTPARAAELKASEPVSGTLPEPGRAHLRPPSNTPAQLLASPTQLSVLDFGSSFNGPSRLFAVEDLSDLQQQAEFFISLGEYEQAIAVLRQHLEESVEPSPLTYLDLFMLYHKLGRIDDYERLRVAFAERFNARAPAFEHYGHAGEGLEGHTKTLARLTQLWPDVRVLDFIERLLFSRSEGEGRDVLDLEAYRDLLLLHAIAQDLAERPSRPSTGFDFQHTNIEPLHLLRTPAEGRADFVSGLSDDPKLPHEVVPPASPRLALDIDLGEFDPWNGRSPRA